jgi:acyl-CoA synthetase (AMP-forming)/AMP-acid ligase II
MAPPELLHMIEWTEASALVAQPRLAPQLAAIGTPPVPDGGDLCVLSLSSPLGAASWCSVDVAHLPDVQQPIRAQPELSGLLTFSSGSTGAPKGIEIGQGTLVQVGERVARSVFGAPQGKACIDLDDTVQTPIPVYTASVILNGMAPCLWGGSRLVLEDARFDPVASQRRMVQYGSTIVNAAPAHYWMMTEHDPPDGAALEPRLVVAGGSPLTRSHYERMRARFPKSSILNWYALNETVAAQTISYGPDMERDPTSIGRPVWPTEVRVVDENGGTAPTGSIGELWMRCPAQMMGYFKAPDITAETMVEGWIRTGDLASIGPDGLIRIAGRAKEWINRGGFKFYPAEVVDALTEHPLILEAAVIGVPHPALGQEAVAFVVCRGEADLTASEVRDWCRTRVARNKVPTQVWFLDSLPRNSYAKVQTAHLLDLYLRETQNGLSRSELG